MATAPIVVPPSGGWEGHVLGFGTPPQYVRVLVSTTCPQAWAVDPQGCTPLDSSDCPSNRGGIFNRNKSSSWQDQGLYELDQQKNLGFTGNGDFGLDSLTLAYPGSGTGHITIDNQILATIATKDFYLAAWGIAPRPTNLTTSAASEGGSTFANSHQSLLSTLKQENRIPSLSYGYTAGASYRLNQVAASLTFGGYDASRFVPSNLTLNLGADNSRDLLVGLQSISVIGSSHRLLPTPVLAFVDSTVPHLWLPLEACKVFEDVFGISWDPTSDLYLVNETTHQALLAQNASLVFTIGAGTQSLVTTNITLPYASFDLQLSNSYPNVTNSTRYFPLRRAANETQYTLGRAFLQETYLIADYERSTFSINQCQFVANIPQDIRTILPLIATNTTITTSHNRNPSHGLSPGIIAAIAIGSAIFLITVIIFSILLWRRTFRSSQVPALAQSDHSDKSSETVHAANSVSEHELHAEPKPPAELHAVSMGPFEMADAVVPAAEVASSSENALSERVAR